MGGYADTKDPAAELQKATAEDEQMNLKDAIKNASLQVQAVNWIYEQVTGQNLVETLIAPITGDFSKINENSKAWERVGKALRAVRSNLNDGTSELRNHWDGTAAVAFEGLMTGVWTTALEADAKVADLISQGFAKAAETSQMLCQKALELFTKLINYLIEAAATAWIPVAGWANAVKIIIRCVNIANAILDIIRAVQEMYKGVVTMVKGVMEAGTALSKIPEIRSVDDATDVANDLGDAAGKVTSGATKVGEGATSIKQAGTDAGSNKSEISDIRSESSGSDSSSSSSSGSSSSSSSSSGSDSSSSSSSDSSSSSSSSSSGSTPSSSSSSSGSQSGYQTAMSGNL